MGMSEIELVEGEALLWRGEPDFTKAGKAPKSWHHRRMVHVAWLVGLALAAMVVFYLGHLVAPPWLRNTLGGGLVLFFLFTLLGFVHAKPRPADLATEPPVFIVTDRRVTRIDGPDARFSLYAHGLAAARLEPNGEVHDLSLYGMTEDAFIQFTAIADGPAVEKLITSTLVAPLKGAPS